MSEAVRPTHPELLARVEAALESTPGLSERRIEESCDPPLPQAFLSKAKRGGNSGARSEPTWARLKAWLDQHYPSAVQVELARQTDEQGVLQDLAHRLRNAQTLEELGEAMKIVTELNVLGTISDPRARCLQILSLERRQLFKMLEEQRKAVDARKPVVVHIVWSSDWRAKVATNEAAANAEG